MKKPWKECLKIFHQLLYLKHAYTAIMVSKSSDTTVLIMGKNGAGKELITKVIHDNSSRQDNRMMAVNCTATAQSLIESE